MRKGHFRSFASVACLLGLSALAGPAEAVPPVLSRTPVVMPVSPAILAHVMKPANVTSARGVAGPLFEPPNGFTPVQLPPRLPQLDVNGFGTALNHALGTSATGYAMELRQNGNVIGTGIWNWSQTPSDTAKGWNFDTRMHIASVSKLMTGIALYKVLLAKGISLDDTISQYLPAYWSQGANVNQITFRNLVTHRSGFNTGGSGSDYQLMKQYVAQGVTTTGPNALGTYHYQNMNYGLCRILISVIDGDIGVNAQFPAATMDQAWDYTTITSYERYVQNNVFTPSGVSDASLVHDQGDALAYGFYPDNGHGWNSGDLTTMAGGAAWHMTLNDVMKVMSTVRRAGSILTPAQAETMLESYVGIDSFTQTPAGPLFTKNGLWTDGNHTEQDVIFFLPENVELVVFVNSPDGQTPAGQGGPGIWLSGVVQQLYLANLH